MVLSTHSRTHLRSSLCRVGQTPRRALRVTRTVVEKLFDDRLARRGTRPLSAGRPRPAAVRAGARHSETRIHVADRLRAGKLPEGRRPCQAERGGLTTQPSSVSVYAE